MRQTYLVRPIPALVRSTQGKSLCATVVVVVDDIVVECIQVGNIAHIFVVAVLLLLLLLKIDYIDCVVCNVYILPFIGYTLLDVSVCERVGWSVSDVTLLLLLLLLLLSLCIASMNSHRIASHTTSTIYPLSDGICN